MNALNRLKIGARLGFVLACVMLTLAAVAAAGLWGLNEMARTSLRVIAQDLQLAQQADKIQNLVLLSRRYEKDALINMADEARREDYAKKWNAVRVRMLDALAQVKTLELGAEDRQAVDGMARHFERYAAGVEATLAMVRRG